MGSKRFNRRELLKSGATLAGGFTLGAAAPALGQEPMTHASPPMIKGDNDGQIAYGDRSKHVKSVRIPHGGRPSPDNLAAKRFRSLSLRRWDDRSGRVKLGKRLPRANVSAPQRVL